MAAACGLTGRLGGSIPDQQADPTDTARAAFFGSLRDAVLDRAWATVDAKRAKTALEWFRDFLRDSGRVPFVAMAHVGDLQAGVYNRETLEAFAEYIRRSGSRSTGKRHGAPLTSDTIATYGSTIGMLRGLESHYSIALKEANVRQPKAMKLIRQEVLAGSGTRTLSRGLRAALLRTALTQRRPIDLSTQRGAIEGGAALLAHNLLLRGGEVCCVEDRPFDSGRDLTFDAIEFMAPCAESRGMRWLTVDVVAVKDTVARHRVCPMPVRQRGGGGDIMCPYAAVCRLWQARLQEAPPSAGRIASHHAAAKAPLFTAADGRPWDTRDTRSLARRFALELGIPTAEVGAKAFRIGGATDLQVRLGTDGGQKVIKQRGRWASDVAAVYQRALAEVHLDASASIGDAQGRELESLIEGWAQPAQFR